jgi:hypothetical protein
MRRIRARISIEAARSLFFAEQGLILGMQQFDICRQSVFNQRGTGMVNPLLHRGSKPLAACIVDEPLR